MTCYYSYYSNFICAIAFVSPGPIYIYIYIHIYIYTYIYILRYSVQNTYMRCGAVITRPIFLKIHTKDTPKLARILSCDQAALRTRLSVRPSVCLSVCYTFFTMFPSWYHPEIFRSYYQWQMWCPCKRSRSKVKVTEVMTPLNRFRTGTPVWIHIWRSNDAQSLMLLRGGALLFFKVIRQISRSHG